MSLLEFQFNITEIKNCPIYKKGDYFELSGVEITPSQKKKICVYPVKVIADVLDSLKDLEADSDKKDLIGKEYNCGGCKGIIKFVCAKKDVGWSIPQIRMMEEFEAQKAMEKKMTALDKELKGFTMLSCLDENGLKDFVSCTTLEEFPKDHTVLRVDTPGKNLFLLLEGSVVLLSRSGDPIGYLGKGEVFGEMSLMFDRLVNVTVKSVEPLKVLMVNANDFNQLLLKYPFIKMELARMMAKRLSKSNEPITKEGSPGFHGRLKELPLPELFQMIHENMKSGTVELKVPGGDATVEFVKGEVTDSNYLGTQGKDAFYNIVMEQEGSFTFNSSMQSDNTNHEPIGGFMSMLMEGLRQLDEKKSSALEQNSTVAEAG